MIDSTPWSTGRPRWSAMAGGTIIAVAGLCLIYCFSWLYAALIALAACGRVLRGKRLGSYLHAARIHCNDGQWFLDSSGSRRPVSLTNAWSGFAWWTLRFRDLNACNSKEAMFELTIWKVGMSAEAWRQLCLSIAWCTAMQPRAAARGA